MLRVGVTGGIGSGKSMVCSIIAAMDYPVYHADSEAKRLINSHPKIIGIYKQLFGDDIYFQGKLNAQKVAGQVFGNALLLEQLNSVVHPLVAEHFENWCELNKESTLVFKEAAILFESGASKHLHRVIGVFAPESVRIQRVISRDGATENEVLKRMANQMTESRLKELCDYSINNTGNDMLLPQVLSIIEQLEGIESLKKVKSQR